jgi:uncharacterized membrane protein YczE
MLFPHTVPTRLGWFVTGLGLLAAGLALLVRADLGLPPWDVLVFGMSELLGVSPVLGRFVVVGLALAAMPLVGGRVRYSMLVAAVVFGPMVSLAIGFFPDVDGLAPRMSALVLGIVLSGIGLGIYVVPALFVSPTDEVCGLLAFQLQRSLWVTRGVVEGLVLVVGAAAGGSIGLGTVAYALFSGVVMQRTVEAAGQFATRR